jgi:hypothetical protein
MAVSFDAFKHCLHRDGPISVVDKAGNGVTHAPSGMAKPVDPKLAHIHKVEEIQLVLLDEMTNVTRAIRGDQIEEINRTPPGWQIVVDDTFEPDEGTRIKTRGV